MNENTPVAIIDTPAHSAIVTHPHGDEAEEAHVQVHQFVDALFEPSDILEFRILPSRQSRWTLASTVEDVVPWLIKQNNDGQSIYVGCNPPPAKVTAPGQRTARDADDARNASPSAEASASTSKTRR